MAKNHGINVKLLHVRLNEIRHMVKEFKRNNRRLENNDRRLLNLRLQAINELMVRGDYSFASERIAHLREDLTIPFDQRRRHYGTNVVFNGRELVW